MISLPHATAPCVRSTFGQHFCAAIWFRPKGRSSANRKRRHIERRGSTVPEAISTNIDKLKVEVADRGFDRARLKDKEATQASYQKDIDRFKTLQDVVEFRRSSSGGDER